jgi:carbamoyltransferase
MTAYCGFKVNSGEYKLMGLAPYGKPTFTKLLKQNLLRLFDDGSLALNMKYFGFTRGLNMHNQNLVNLLGYPPRKLDQHIEPRYCDLAASVQNILNEAMTKLAGFALSTCNSKKLCLAGGVALNCVSNSRLKEDLGIEEIYVQPAAGDAGGALGAGYLGLLQNQPNLVRSDFVPLESVFLGTQYKPAEIKDAIAGSGLRFVDFENQHDNFCRNVAMLLGKERVIGWFSHRMEFGPRSLGARSILGDPRSQKMQKLMNLRIKFRESFRPFAPSVLETHVGDYFEWSGSSPFMLFTAQVKGLNQGIMNNHTGGADLEFSLRRVQQSSPLPAITHIDGSARIQTVSSVNPLYPVIKAFEARTGVPVLINTSFNVRGEPIVESPRDAINCFLSTDIDVLAIYPYLVLKSDQVGLKRVNTKPSAWGLD